MGIKLRTNWGFFIIIIVQTGIRCLGPEDNKSIADRQLFVCVWCAVRTCDSAYFNLIATMQYWLN